ncbi:MAG: acyltransferase [Oricola sp.]
MNGTGGSETAGGRARARALPGRFHWLDFFRFLAAMTVVLHHYYFFFFDGTTLVPDSAQMAARSPFAAMGFFYDHGQYAVQFFWVLSGFVFAHSYFARPADGIGFAAARFARLYPLHFATLVIIAALQLASLRLTGASQVTAHNDAYHFGLQLFLVSAWGFQAGESFNAPIWSVSAEIGAYIAFFFLHRRPLFRSAAGQVLAIAAAIAVSRAVDAREVPVCAAFFFAGCLVYLLLRDRKPADLALAGVTALYALTFLETPMAAALCGFSALVLVTAWLDTARLPGGQRLGRLGDVTYSVYLLHMPMIVAALTAFDIAGTDKDALLSSPLMLAGYAGLVIALSAICHRTFERPADRAIRAWVRRRRASGGADGIKARAA